MHTHTQQILFTGWKKKRNNNNIHPCISKETSKVNFISIDVAIFPIFSVFRSLPLVVRLRGNRVFHHLCDCLQNLFSSKCFTSYCFRQKMPRFSASPDDKYREIERHYLNRMVYIEFAHTHKKKSRIIQNPFASIWIERSTKTTTTTKPSDRDDFFHSSHSSIWCAGKMRCSARNCSA